MLNTNKYVLLDNSDYLDFFCRNLKDEYIPIVLHDRDMAILDAKKIDYLGVLDYLSVEDLNEIRSAAVAEADLIRAGLDNKNRANYKEIFGSEDIRLMKSTIGYLFKTFVVNSLRFVRGLEAIAKRHKIEELAYLHGGATRFVCGTKKERGFFFPDNIGYTILNLWQYPDKPKIVIIDAKRRKRHLPDLHTAVMKSINMALCLRRACRSLKKWSMKDGKYRRDFQGDFQAGRKTILFLSPFYDFEFAARSGSLAADYNILTWNMDNVPETKTTSIVHERDNGTIDKLIFDIDGLDPSRTIYHLSVADLTIPLIRYYFKKKSADILRYWNHAKSIWDKNKVDMVIWGVSPHRYPTAMTKEFFRLKGVPVCGMQHGGSYGVYDVADYHSELDFGNCDYFFSYGFEYGDLPSLERDAETCPEKFRIIPVGSPHIKMFKDGYEKAKVKKRRRIDMILPVQECNESFFYGSMYNYPGIYRLWKKMIDTAAEFENKKIVIKLLPCQHEHAIVTYIRHKYPRKFIIIGFMPFTRCLRVFDIDSVIIEETGTPLHQATVTDSSVIVYDMPQRIKMTDPAHRLLSQRAIVCRDEETFLSRIRQALEGNCEKKDPNSGAFDKKYSIYEGQPDKNIERAIRSLLESMAPSH